MLRKPVNAAVLLERRFGFAVEGIGTARDTTDIHRSFRRVV